MAKQTTFMMIKPDAYKNHHVFEIKQFLLQHGCTIEKEHEIEVDMKVMQTLLIHYEEVINRLGKDFNFVGKLFNSFYFDGPHTICPMMVSYEEDVISFTRHLVGQTNPQEAAKNTIRNMFSNDSYELATLENRLINNCIHASDSLENAKKEIKIWEDYL